METLLSSYSLVEILSLLLGVALVTVVMLLFTLMSKRITAQNRAIDMLRRDVSALCKGAEGVDGKLVRVEQRIRRLVEQQEKSELVAAGHSDYSQAIRMIERGASLQEVIEVCGLISTEAKLLMLVHQGGEPGATRRTPGHAA